MPGKWSLSQNKKSNKKSKLTTPGLLRANVFLKLRGAKVNSHSADGDRNGTDGRRVKITARSFNPGDDQCPESAD